MDATPVSGSGSGWLGRTPYTGGWQAGRRPGWATSSVLGYAQWGSRVIAALVDDLVLALPTVLVLWSVSKDGFRASSFIDYAVAFICTAPYFTILSGTRLGQTVGYRSVNISVRDARSGGPIGFPRAFVRYFVRFLAYVLFGLPGLINDLWPLWDPMRQTLADKAVGAVVVQLAPGVR